MTLRKVCSLLVWVVGCGSPSPVSPPDAGVDAGLSVVDAGAADAGHDAGVWRDAGTVDAGGPLVPCDVAQVISANCLACHGGTTNPSLLTRADFLEASAFPGQTVGERCSSRMHSMTAPMPPSGSPVPSPNDIAAFDLWLARGMPEGTCEVGAPVDAGVTNTATTCSSNVYWLLGTLKSPDMNPGTACKTCHLFFATFKTYAFMGTVYPQAHERDLCAAYPTGEVKVEIVDKAGKVALTLKPSQLSGNFSSGSIFNPVAMPYTARVVSPNGVREMRTPQTNGDCNACHTATGANGAAGRITWP